MIRRALFVAFFLIVALLLFLFINPLNLAVKTSSRFSWRAFDVITRGMPIETVIATLGPPVEIGSQTWTSDGETVRTFVCGSGQPSVGGVDAGSVVLVREDGKVASTITHIEP